MVKGILDFKPADVTKKHKAHSAWKRVAIIKTNCDIDRYYAWFLEKRFNLVLNRNLRGSHVTIISDIVDFKVFEQASKVFNGKEITFYYELDPRANKQGHWWLKVHCPEAENIRELLGLSKNPYYGLHLTLGKANEKNIDHSNYIIRVRKDFLV